MKFPNILSLTLFDNSWGNSFIPVYYASFDLWWKKSLLSHQNIWKRYEHGCRCQISAQFDNFDSLDQIAQKEYYQLKTEKVNLTIDFCRFELV